MIARDPKEMPSRQASRSAGRTARCSPTCARPTAMIVVTGFIDPRWKVGIEADAVLGRSSKPVASSTLLSRRRGERTTHSLPDR